MDDASFRALLAYNRETKLLDDVYRSAVKKCGLPECAFWILYTLQGSGLSAYKTPASLRDAGEQ